VFEIYKNILKKLVKIFILFFCQKTIFYLILQIFRKVAYKIVKDSASKIVVDDGNLQEFVGKPMYTSDRMYELTPPGVSMGLAWTANGMF